MKWNDRQDLPDMWLAEVMIISLIIAIALSLGLAIWEFVSW